MALNTKIEWCDHTFNPWVGCTKVSPGCLHCYAEQLMAIRYGRVEWGAGKPRVRTSEKNWSLPIFWERRAARDAHEMATTGKVTDEDGNVIAWHRPRVFCASLADWLDAEVAPAWLLDLLDLVRLTPHLDWLLLTKRPQLFKERMRAVWDARTDDRIEAATVAFNWLHGDDVPANVWIGTTVEDQQRADERIPHLLQIPAAVRFLSVEPMLGPVDLTWHIDRPDVDKRWPSPIHWVICGGESGATARQFVAEYAWDLHLQCRKAGVPFFMKQLGCNVRTTNANALSWPVHAKFYTQPASPLLAGDRVKLRDWKGGDFSEFPRELQVREVPS